MQTMIIVKASATACKPNPWLGGDNGGARSKFVGRSSLAFGPGCISLHSFFIFLPMLPRCPEGCLVNPSNTALRYLPVLLSPAPLRCGVGKGHPEQCGRKWLHTKHPVLGQQLSESAITSRCLGARRRPGHF